MYDVSIHGAVKLSTRVLITVVCISLQFMSAVSVEFFCFHFAFGRYCLRLRGVALRAVLAYL